MQTLTFSRDGDDLSAHLIPAPGLARPAPTVILLSAIAGINPYIVRTGHRMAEAGFSVVLMDYYSREGRNPDCSTRPRIMDAVRNLPDTRVLADLRALLATVGEHPELDGDRVGLLGFCIGGMYSFLGGCELPVRAVVDYYGTVRYAETSDTKPYAPLDRVDLLGAPLLAHFGDVDRLISADDRSALEASLQERGKAYELFVYHGAPHAFDEDFRDAHRPAAAADAWRRTVAFLRWHLLGQGSRS